MAKSNLFAVETKIAEAAEEEEEEEAPAEPSAPLRSVAFRGTAAASGGGGGGGGSPALPKADSTGAGDAKKAFSVKKRRPTWKQGIKTKKEAKKDSPKAPPSPVLEGQDGYKGTILSLADLTDPTNVPDGIDNGRKEAYLSAAEFFDVFAMDKEAFYK